MCCFPCRKLIRSYAHSPGSICTCKWSTHSYSNLSLRPKSLLTGKRTGNFASSIAAASPWQTASEAIKLEFIGYLLSFLIVLSPPLLLIGSLTQSAEAIGTTLAGTGMLICGVQGWLNKRLGIVERLLAIMSGGLLLWIDPWMEAVGAALAVALVIIALRRNRKSVLQPAHHGSPPQLGRD